MAEFEMIAKTFLGLEEVLAKELTELGANNVMIGNRMVSFTGDKALMYRANFQLRTAIRILKPFKHFRASSADEVYEICRKIEWEEYMTQFTSFSVDAVVNSEDFTHSKFVAYRVKDAIADYFREKAGQRPNVSVANPDIIFHIHISNEDCSLSLDSSGESLHRRGYRQDTMEAPLNEVLAAGMLLLAGWDGQCDFVDPMCGSGTLPIEAALIARNIAPGVFRSQFAFEKWSDFDAELFERIYNDDSAERPFDGHIYGYDKDPKAILTAKRNAKAASVLDMIQFAERDLKNFEPVTEKTLMVTNPPYGERLKEGDIPALYETLGERLKHAFVGSEAWVICNHFEYFDKIGLKPSAKIPLYNGALACELRKYEVFSGKYDSFRSEGSRLKKEDTSTRRGKTLRHKAAQEEKRRQMNGDEVPEGEIGNEEKQQHRVKRPFRRTEKPERGEGRSFAKGESRGHKSFVKSDFGQHKSFGKGDSGEHRSFAKGDSTAERKPFRKSDSDSGRKPSGERRASGRPSFGKDRPSSGTGKSSFSKGKPSFGKGRPKSAGSAGAGKGGVKRTTRKFNDK